jgi:hypothetical protein
MRLWCCLGLPLRLRCATAYLLPLRRKAAPKRAGGECSGADPVGAHPGSTLAWRRLLVSPLHEAAHNGVPSHVTTRLSAR